MLNSSKKKVILNSGWYYMLTFTSKIQKIDTSKIPQRIKTCILILNALVMS